MRGKVVPKDCSTKLTRITPAYAGKSYEIDVMAKSIQDHPRLCGEKFHNFIFHKLFIGSPPPMRGKDCLGGILQKGNRITPAYAGKRPPEAPAGCCPAGSPPPMRGKGATTLIRQRRTRITPAYAGKRE